MVLGIIGTSIGLLIFAMCAACAKKMNDLGKEIEKEAKKGASSRLAAPTGPTAKLGEPVTFDGDSTWVRITNLGQKEDLAVRSAAGRRRQGARVQALGRRGELPPAGEEGPHDGAAAAGDRQGVRREVRGGAGRLGPREVRGGAQDRLVAAAELRP
jgi:hypothetical protein